MTLLMRASDRSRTGGPPRRSTLVLLGGDPLRLWELGSRRLRRRASLIEARRLYLRAAELVERAAATCDGDPPSSRWVRARVDRAIDDLLAADLRAERERRPPGQGWSAPAELPTELHRMDAWRARAVCNSFNALPERTRRAWWEVVLEGVDLRRHAARENLPPDRVQVLVGRAMLALALPGSTR